MSFVKVTMVGRISRDPELQYTAQGTPVCTFSVAVNEKRRNKWGEVEEAVSYFRVSVWGARAASAQRSLSKGRPIYLEGKLRISEYADKSGGLRYSLDVQATEFQLIDCGDVKATEEAREAGEGKTRTSQISRPGTWTLVDGKPVKIQASEDEQHESEKGEAG